MTMDVFWLEQRLADVPASEEWLSVWEAARQHALKVPKRRADWRLGRWTAKRAVAGLLEISENLANIEIVADASGAPRVLVSGEPVGVSISLSHRAGMAACAVSEQRGMLGCDLESIEPRSDAFLADYFTPEEQAWISAADAGERPRLSALFWSAKESALKALREGLRMDTRAMRVMRIESALDQGWRSLRIQGEADDSFEGWWCEADGMVRTVIAKPAPAVPIPLSASVMPGASPVAST